MTNPSHCPRDKDRVEETCRLVEHTEGGVMKLRGLIHGTVLSVALLAGCGDGGTAPLNDSISETALSSDLHFLASDEMRGRLVGTPEIAVASTWIRDRFESLGLQPAGDAGSYYQTFEITSFSLGDGNRLTVDGSGRARNPGEGWTPSNAGGSGTATAEVVFAGFGIVEPRLNFDDYSGADLSERIVLVLEREPGVSDPASPFDGLVTTEASREWRKALAAQERGAAGILFTRDIHNRVDAENWEQAHTDAWPTEPRRVERFTLADWINQINIPAARISSELAEALVASSGRSLKELALAAEATTDGLGIVSLPNTRVSMNVAVDRHITPAKNILALAEGSDPQLKNEVVIIGAHHDHDGTDGDIIYPGADDDGSGTIGVMAVAAAYAQAARQGDHPQRSVLFAVWDAEERGLLGAWYHTLSPRFPLENTVANLNLDMIGRNEEVPTDGGRRFRGLEVQSAESNANAINILGYSWTPELASVVELANRYDLELRMRYDNNESNLLRRSDHWPFIQSGVPAIFFHTGLHPDYHRPTDTPDRIEYEKMTRILRLVHQTSWDLANTEKRPKLEAMGTRPSS